MKKVLITGAGGFIGKELVKEILGHGTEIIAVVRNKKDGGIPSDMPSGIRIVRCGMENIEKLPQIIDDRDIDCCIHLAWEGSAGDARADAGLQLKNAEWSVDLVKAIGSMNIPRFVGAGTLAEKDVLRYHPTDGATPNGVSMYGAAKVTAHFMTKIQCSVLKIEHIWCLLSNTYGVGNTTDNFVNFASRLMLQGKRAAFTEGEQMYDFVYITDTVRALWAAACKGSKNTQYYLGSTKPRKLKEYITLIRDTVDPDIELYLGEILYNGFGLPEKEYECTKLLRDTGFEPAVPFEEGIRKTVSWLKNTYLEPGN